MPINSYIKALSEKLRHPLPGLDAHLHMSPNVRNSKHDMNTPNAQTKEGAVLILLYPKNGELQLPLMLRPTYDGAHSGQVSLPGGKRELTDANLIQTALRETEEEIGVPQSDVTILGQLTNMFIYASNFMVTPVVGYTEAEPAFVPEPIEVAEIIRAPLEHLLNPTSKKKKDIHVRGFNIHAPYYDVDGHVVWGATAMMLSEFLEITRQIRASEL